MFITVRALAVEGSMGSNGGWWKWKLIVTGSWLEGANGV